MARILVAEDDNAVGTQVARALRQDGHEITLAADGAAALDQLAQAEGQFDLLLTDIQMPVMDGIALALAAARDYPDLMIMMMTGYADQRERASGLDALVHDVLTKPFTLHDLRLSVRGALAARAH
jgi:two-component system cell cycle response regulator CpdR